MPKPQYDYVERGVGGFQINFDHMRFFSVRPMHATGRCCILSSLKWCHHGWDFIVASMDLQHNAKATMLPRRMLSMCTKQKT